MKLKKILLITAIVAASLVMLLQVAVWIVQPYLKDKLEERINQSGSLGHLSIAKVQIHLLNKGVTFSDITYRSDTANTLNACVDALNIQNIRIFKALVYRDFCVGAIVLTGLEIRATMPDSIHKRKSFKIPFLFKTDRFYCVISGIEVSNIPDFGKVSTGSGRIQLDDLIFSKGDSLNFNHIDKFQYSIGQLTAQTADSNYRITLDTIKYSSYRKALSISRVRLLPLFEHYAFASRKSWQTDRFDVDLRHTTLYHFSFMDLIAHKNMICREIEIKNALIEAFRDKRKPFKHVSKPMFNEMIYRYPGRLQIDTLNILNSRIVYLEHNKDALKAGKIFFENAALTLTNITNDSLSSSEFKLKGRSLLMGRSRFSVELTSKNLDQSGTFHVKGHMDGMPASAFNPMLEESAFVTIKSGRLAKIEFSFFANQHMAAGDLVMIYDSLNLAFLNPSDKENPGFKTVVQTWLLNQLIIDSNPQKNNLPRKGIILYKRDPERFLFNYCAKAIFSGIKTTILKM